MYGITYKDLRSELESKHGKIYTNQLTMSVGELINFSEMEMIQ